VLYAFFKRYTWHILGFINIFSNSRVLTPLCSGKIWLLLFYSFCSDWRIKICTGHWKNKSSASRCEAICRWFSSFYGTSWGKTCVDSGCKITLWIITVLFIYPILIIGALLKCTVAKIGFEKKKVSQGFEALARAQCLLRSKPSLAKMTLLSQVRKFF
jgi:hypothetical protein